ncbi:hypothetical protein [Xanthobacter versatilis]
MAILSSAALSGCLLGPSFYHEYQAFDGVVVKGGANQGTISGARNSDEAYSLAEAHCQKFMQSATLQGYARDISYFYCGNPTW